MRVLSTILCLLFLQFGLDAQQSEGPWKALADVSYEQQYSEMLGFDIDVPVFGEKVRALEGEIITLTGYIVPLEGFGAHKEFIFSALPYNMCYFCGGAGPETVMEVFASEEVPYTAEAITLKGKLVLNRDDVNRLMYFLLEAEQVD